MYTVDLHLKGETISSALANLNSSIKIAKKTKEQLLCVIVGYGSSGGSHKIKSSVLEELEKMKKIKQIKDYIIGNEIDIFNPKYQQFTGKTLLDNISKIKRNPGEIIIHL